MHQQLSFIQEDGSILRDKGMRQALDHAEEACDKWADRAMVALEEFCKGRPGTFMAEDFRRVLLWTQVPRPPSDRAFGGIFTRAARLGWIRRVGYGLTVNSTPAAVWESLITAIK